MKLNVNEKKMYEQNHGNDGKMKRKAKYTLMNTTKGTKNTQKYIFKEFM